MRASDALNVNPVAGVDEALSVHGSDWLWAITAIYIVSFVSHFCTLILISPIDIKHSLAS